MARCIAPNHPDCWHECDGDNCIAFYEPETGLCIRGCDGQLLGIGFITAIARNGWDVRTTAEVCIDNISQIERAAHQVHLLATSSQQTSTIERPSSTFLHALEAVMETARSQRGTYGTTQISWKLEPLSNVFEIILDSISPRLLRR